MHKIAENGIITLNAGDAFFAPLYLNCGTNLEYKRYVLTDKDTIYFSIMKPHQSFEHGIIRKIYTAENLDKNGDVVISLNSTDTEDLKPGTYYYEIKFLTIRKNVEYVDTVVPRKKLYIL